MVYKCVFNERKISVISKTNVKLREKYSDFLENSYGKIYKPPMNIFYINYSGSTKTKVESTDE